MLMREPPQLASRTFDGSPNLKVWCDRPILDFAILNLTAFALDPVRRRIWASEGHWSLSSFPRRYGVSAKVSLRYLISRPFGPLLPEFGNRMSCLVFDISFESSKISPSPVRHPNASKVFPLLIGKYSETLNRLLPILVSCSCWLAPPASSRGNLSLSMLVMSRLPGVMACTC